MPNDEFCHVLHHFCFRSSFYRGVFSMNKSFHVGTVTAALAHSSQFAHSGLGLTLWSWTRCSQKTKSLMLRFCAGPAQFPFFTKMSLFPSAPWASSTFLEGCQPPSTGYTRQPAPAPASCSGIGPLSCQACSILICNPT